MIYLVIWIHWLADFVCQTDKMAKGKSKSNKWLSFHILTYTMILLIPFGPRYALVNGAVHFCVDYITSRITSKLWAKGQVHNFFVVIGIDQAIHMTCLIYTMPLIWRFL